MQGYMQIYKRESDKTLWFDICGNPKSQIAMVVNNWWHTLYPTYKMKICNKETFDSIKKKNYP